MLQKFNFISIRSSFGRMSTEIYAISPSQLVPVPHLVEGFNRTIYAWPRGNMFRGCWKVGSGTVLRLKFIV